MAVSISSVISAGTITFNQYVTITTTITGTDGGGNLAIALGNNGTPPNNFVSFTAQYTANASAQLAIAYTSSDNSVIVFSGNPSSNTWIITWTIKPLQNTNSLYSFVVYKIISGGFIQGNTLQLNVTSVTNPRTGVPTAPSGLVLTEPTPRNIHLAWTDNSSGTTGEDGFEVWRSIGNISFDLQSRLGVNVNSYDDTNVLSSTLYYYRIYAFNELGKSTPLSGSITTAAQIVAPTAPSGLTVSSADGYSATLAWTDNSSNELGFNVKRASVTGGPYTTVASVAAGVVGYTDNGLLPQTTYFYVVSAFVWGAESANSNEASITTPPVQLTLSSVCPFTLDPLSVNNMYQVAQRLFVTSNLDRWVIYANRHWYLAGLKPQLVKPTTGTIITGGLTGTFTFYICLYRSDDSTRSIPGPVSDSVVLSSQTLTVTPQLNAGSTAVQVRDIGYDSNGVQINGCDYWEIYVGEQNLGNAYLVAQVPIASLSYAIAATWTIDKLTNGQQRTMEVNFESLLPPACSFAAFYNNRLYAFGETTIKPTSAEFAAGASLTITQGATQFTLTDYEVNDAVQYKQVYLNKAGTGWFVSDVIDSQTVQIRNPDPNIQAQGFRGTTGTYHDFAFAANPSRVYASAYFTGEPLGGITFSPETFPPLTIFESEFDPDDNTDPSGAITSRDALMIAKPQKWFFVTGGTEPDFPLISVTAISRGSGLLAPNTICRDRYDTVYYLSEQGLHRVSQSGVEKITDFTGNAHLFQELFDVSSIQNAVATWFSREDYFVCSNINRIGNAGNLDGFIYDSRNNAIVPFSTTRRLTAMIESRMNNGDLQLLFGDAGGYVGAFLVKNLYTDNRDFTKATPSSSESAVACYVRSGIQECQNAVTIRAIKPRLKQTPITTGISCTVGFDFKSRNADPSTYTADISQVFLTTVSPNQITFGGNRGQTFQQQFSFSSLVSLNTARLEFSGMTTTIVNRAASAN